MIEKKKVDDLISSNKNYLKSIKKSELEKYINRDVNSKILNIELNLHEFKFYKNSKNREIEKVMIYFIIYDERNKKYLEYSTFSNLDMKDSLMLKDSTTIVKKISKFIDYNSDLIFNFIVIPIKKENNNKIFLLEKAFYKADSIDNNHYVYVIDRLKQILLFLINKIFPLFILIIIPVNIYIYLIEYIGLVDSLIDISVISTSFIYLLNSVLNLLKENLFFVFIGLIFFIPIYGILIICTGYIFTLFFTKIYILFRKFILSETEINYYIVTKKINLIRTKRDLIPLFKVFKNYKYYSLTFFTYIVSFLILALVFFIDQTTIENKNKTIISISANNYLTFSAFPRIVYIKNDNESKKVLFMGYDRVFSYYYELDYIENILKKYEEEEIERILDKYGNNIIEFKTIFELFIVGKINNNNIKAIKNDMYKICDNLNSNIDRDEILINKKLLLLKYWQSLVVVVFEDYRANFGSNPEDTYLFKDIICK